MSGTVITPPTSRSLVGVRATTNATQAIATATWTSKLWPTEAFDTSLFHDTSTNKNRITIPAGLGGYYLITCGVFFASSATGVRQLMIEKNAGASPNTGTQIGRWGPVAGVAGGNWITVSTGIVLLAAGDEVQCQVWQNSGGNLNTGNDANEFFSLTLVGY